ncbi:hypothetical protein PLESTM_002074700 [Pleodorina starrii]|nr:hypothetical protein PLESTM_002074700 [Pleodorina starrii]
MQTVTIGGRWTAYYQFHWPQVAWLNLAKDLYEAVMYSDANPSASIYTVPTLPGSRTASIVASACRASGSTLLDNEAPGEDDTAVSSLPEKLGDGGGAGPADGGQLRDLTVAAAEQPRQGDDDAPRAGGLGDGGGAAPADVGQLRDLTAAAAEQPRQGDDDAPRAGGLGDGGGAAPADGGQLRDLTAAAAEQPRQDDDDAPRAGGLGDVPGATAIDGTEGSFVSEMEEGSTDAEVQSPAVEETEARLQGKEVTYASRHPVKRRKPSPSAMQAGSSAEQELDPDISVWVAGIVTDSSAGPSSQVGHKSVPAALYKCEGIKHARSYLEMAGVVTLEPPELKELLDKIPDAAEAAIQLCKLKGEPIFQELRHNNDGNYCYDKHDKGRLLMDYGTGGQRWMATHVDLAPGVSGFVGFLPLEPVSVLVSPGSHTAVQLYHKLKEAQPQVPDEGIMLSVSAPKMVRMHMKPGQIVLLHVNTVHAGDAGVLNTWSPRIHFYVYQGSVDNETHPVEPMGSLFAALF